MYESYGLTYPQPRGAYEADHLIPLELGGNNDIENLFPESAEPRPGFKEKDLVENYLNHEVCAGRLSLLAAQEQIARDWLAVYKGLTTNQIDELKREFSSY
ncbi:MAG: HNH endonuclease signature motif containing protein [bacterium]|nr:HNH endonuclease signature motif containing protein [bacterium]